ncbi:MAG: DUF4928 family protein [Akkermansiaceae bacterium]|nr:DUF4928 family protein [Akkermansiaceae bacterium]
MKLEKCIKDFVVRYGMKGNSLVPARLQSMLALLESLRGRPELLLSSHLSDAGQSLIGHETLGDTAHKRLSLIVLNKNHGRRSSNLHAWGEPLLSLVRRAGFESADVSRKKSILDEVQGILANQLRSILEEGPLRVKMQGKTAETVISEILELAEKRQKAGDVAQYLVGAKLSIRLGRDIPVHGTNKGDRKSHADVDSRLGDFEIENAVLEVAVGLPDEKHLDQIEAILETPDREAWLLTRDDRVAIWKIEISKRFGKQVSRIVVTSVESFVGQNITELAEFSSSGKIDRLNELVELYNSKWVETVGSANIRISLE